MIKRSGLIGIITVIIFSIILFALTLQSSYENSKFHDYASYEIVNKWYDKNENKLNISNLEITDEMMLHTKINCKSYKKPKLVIQTENSNIEAFVSGKKLYQSNNGLFGNTYNIIDLSDVKKEDSVYIRLTPNNKTNGRIGLNSYLTTNNDFLFHLLYQNKASIIILLLLLFILFGYMIFCFFSLIKTKRKAAKHFHACCIIFLLIFICTSTSPLLQFFIGNSTICYAIKYISYSLLPIELISLYQAVSTKSEKIFYAENTVFILYALFRALLFVSFKTPLENGIIISHCILAASVLQCLFFAFKNISNNIQKLKAESFDS